MKEHHVNFSCMLKQKSTISNVIFRNQIRERLQIRYDDEEK